MREGQLSLFQLRRQSKSKSSFVIKKPCAETDFKMVFVKSFCVLGDEVMQLSRGRSQYERTCGEKVVEDGVAIASIATGSVISILSTIGIIGGVASQGIGLVVAIAGIGLSRALSAYNDQKKQKNYALRSELFFNGNVRYYAGKIADQLFIILQERLSQSNQRQTYQIARLSVECISRAILDGDIRSMNELLRPKKLSSIVREILREDFNHLTQRRRSVAHSIAVQANYRKKKVRKGKHTPSNSDFFEPKPAG